MADGFCDGSLVVVLRVVWRPMKRRCRVQGTVLQGSVASYVRLSTRSISSQRVRPLNERRGDRTTSRENKIIYLKK